MAVVAHNNNNNSSKTNSPQSYITNSNFNCKTQRIYLLCSKGECRLGNALFTGLAAHCPWTRVIEPEETHAFSQPERHSSSPRIPALPLE